MQVTTKELCTQLSLHNRLDGSRVTKVHHVKNMFTDKFIPALEVDILQLGVGAILLVPVIVCKKGMQWFVVGTKQRFSLLLV